MKNENIYYVDGRCADKNVVVTLAGITYPDSSYLIKREKSDIYVFEYVLDGEGTVWDSGAARKVKKGDVYILKKGESHRYYSDKKEPMKKIWFNVDGSIIAHLLSDYSLSNTCHIEGFGEPYMFFKIRNKLLECKAERRLHDGEMDILFHMLIKKLSDFEKKKDYVKSEAEILKDYIDSHLDRSLTIKELANHIYRSPSHAINIFKNSFGKTPYDYMLERKIETAKMLLKNTNMKIGDVCTECGFTDGHYFSRYFKKCVGTSPNEYRKCGGEK